MWWYNYGWWWWWVGFLIIFFLIPLVYGWGYRGRGPWYRRRPQPAAGRQPTDRPIAEQDIGWGWTGVFLWVVLIIALLWLIAVFWWPR